MLTKSPMSKTFHLPSLVIACCLLSGLLLSCATPKNTAYFQTIKKDTTLSSTATKNFDLKIVPGDLLSVNITSASPELSSLFNSASSGSTTGYLVDKAGNIQFYKLGNIKVTGLTRTQVKEKLEADLAPYLKDPVATVRFTNHKITVLGEVGSPGVLDLATDQLTLLEAIGKSGDLTKNAKRENILVIRQTESGKEFRHLNLLDHSIFTSPYYYLQNEDVVYVEPERAKADGQKTQQTISYVLSGISILTLILSRIK